MKKIILLILVVLSIGLQAQILHVPDDYLTIQSGIDAASEGDTILVDPGTYIENIDFSGKNICVASRFILTQDQALISQTVIQSQNDTSAVTFRFGEDPTAVLAGFTIDGGYAYQGAGIRCENASPVLQNLVITGGSSNFWGGYGGGIALINSQPNLKDVLITGNYTIAGGGIYMEGSSPRLENVTVRDNRALQGGGVLIFASTPEFDSVRRCNIYLNKAVEGNDFYCSSDAIEVILDTFTVCNPTDVHASPLSNFTFDILNCKVEQISADLFISPVGSDENTGLTEDNPLKTIHLACLKMLADSLNRHTVHLLEGLYSPSATGEFFPVSLPKYVDLIGVSKEEVILDAGGTASVLSIVNNSSVLVRGMTLRNGDADNGAGGGGIYCAYSNPVLRDLIITDNWATYWASGENGGGAYFSYSNPVLENIRVTDNVATHGGGIYFMYGNVAKLNNVIITGNESFGGSGIESFQSTLHLDNTTMADNIEGSGILLGDSWAGINNSIFWGNEGGQISSEAQVKYSDIMGGYQGEGNINVDPGFVGSGDHPYALTENSPCLDTGKPDTTGLGLPRWDILGNYRVWDGDGDGLARIDMGAYEFGAEPVGVGESSVVGRQSSVDCFPNPAKEIVDFRFSIFDGRWVSLKIYNVQGQEVAVVFEGELSAGAHNLSFDVSHLAPGIYFYRPSTIDHRQSKMGKLVVTR